MVAVNMKIVLCMWECIETGAVHFLCIFLVQKTYKVDIQFLVGYLSRKALDSNGFSRRADTL